MKKTISFVLALLFYASILPWTHAEPWNLKAKNLTGDGTGTISGFNIPLNISDNLSLYDAVTAWADVRREGAKCDGSTDDRINLQAVFSSLDNSLGGTIYIPKGKRCRSTDYLYINADNVTITGGGEIWFDTSAFSQYPGFNNGGKQALIFTKNASISGPLDNSDNMVWTGSTIKNITLDDITISSNGTYGAAASTPSHQGIIVWGFDNFQIRNCTVRGFNGEMVNTMLGKYVRAYNNLLTEGAHNAFSGFVVSDYNLIGNIIYRVGQPFEMSGPRFVVANNVATMFNMSGAIIGPSSYKESTNGNFYGNTLYRDPASSAGGYAAHIWNSLSTDSSDALLHNINFSQNVLKGNWTDGIRVGNPSSHAGIIRVNNNNLVMTGTTGNLGIDISKASGNDNSVFGTAEVVDNWLTFETAGYSLAMRISLSGVQGPNGMLKGNIIKAPLGMNTTAYGDKIDNVVNFYNSDISRLIIKDNYYNGKRLEYDYTYDTATDNTLNTYGRSIVKVVPGSARTITSLIGYVGQLVTVHCGDGNTTFVHGANLKMSGATNYACPNNNSVTFVVNANQDGRGDLYMAREISRQ